MNEIQVARGQEAHVYIVEFSDGTVKVGYSARPTPRIRQHQDNAACFGIAIARHWVSAPHFGARKNELKLIAWGLVHAEAVRKKEYFAGIDYAAIQAYAETLPMAGYTDSEFEAYTKELEGQAKSFKPFGSIGLEAFDRPKFPKLTGNLTADEPGHISTVALLAEITEEGARWVLSNEEPHRILSQWLQDLSDACVVKDEPKKDPAVLSAWEWMTSDGGTYAGLIEPLHRAAEAAGIELEENPPWFGAEVSR